MMKFFCLLLLVASACAVSSGRATEVETSWARTVHTSDSFACRVCKDTVQDIKKVISNPDVEEEIVETWNSMCELMPIPLLVKECHDLGNHILPKIFEVLEVL